MKKFALSQVMLAVMLPILPSVELRAETLATLQEIASKDFSPRLAATGTAIRLPEGGAVPFNPSARFRELNVSGGRTIEINPNLPRRETLRAALRHELRLSEWTPAAAGRRYSGADIDSNGTVDLLDLALLMKAYGGTGPQGDLNNDRKVDAKDIEIFSRSYPAPEAILTP